MKYDGLRSAMNKAFIAQIKEKELTVSTIAVALGMKSQNVSNWLSEGASKTEYSIDWIARKCELLNIEYAAIYLAACKICK